jgi:hypothetical protein
VIVWWTLKALPWLKRNWKWLLFPIGIIAFIGGFLLRRRRPDVVAPELVGAAETALKANDKAEEEREEAREEKDEKIAEIEKEHATTVAKLTRKQRDDVEELKDDPDKLNDYLLDVGKDIRNPNG